MGLPFVPKDVTERLDVAQDSMLALVALLTETNELLREQNEILRGNQG